MILIAGSVLWMSSQLFFTVRRISHWNEFQNTPRELVSRMTLEEKVGQLIYVGLSGRTINDGIEQEILQRHPGGIIFFAHNLGSKEEIRKLTEDLQRLSMKGSKIPLFISIDQEGGRVIRVRHGVDQFPGAMALGQTGDPTLAREMGLVTAYQLRELGINLLLAPVLDVNNNPDNPVINTRSFGSDPGLVSRMGRAYAKGVREAYSTPTIKHFPGHGDTDTDSHLSLPTIRRSLEELESIELLPFREAIDDGAEVVMSAHIVFSNLDPERPATLSPVILKNLLRKKLGFHGVIMTDAMEMNAVSGNHAPEESAKLAFKAGADIILLTAQTQLSRNMYDSLLEGFRTGELSMADLDDAVEKQVALKWEKGLFYDWAPETVRPEDLSYFKKLEEKARETYEEVRNKYKKTGIDLNTVISRGGIASLRKDYPGLTEEEKKGAVLYYKTDNLKQEALRIGIPANRVRPRPSWGRLQSDLSAVHRGKSFLVEIGEYEIRHWNRIAKSLNEESDTGSEKAGMAVALYPGNPFPEVTIPERGAVLASFSPTAASVRALIRRAWSGKVRKAQIILKGDEKETQTAQSTSSHSSP